MAHQKPPEAQPSLTFCLSCETANTLQFMVQNLIIAELPPNLFPASIILLFWTEKFPNITVQIWNPPQILQSSVIASEFYHSAIPIHRKSLPIIIFISLTLEFCLQLPPGLVLHKGSHPYITKLKHCVASYTPHLAQHAGWFVPVHWAETII